MVRDVVDCVAVFALYLCVYVAITILFLRLKILFARDTSS